MGKTNDENEAALRLSMSFNAEACRSGLFAAAIDILDTMKKNDIPNGEAALVTGALEMACQLWMQVMLQAGHMPEAARIAFFGQAKTFLRKHSRLREEARAS